MQPLLSVQNVSYSYHTRMAETHVLSEISFDIHKGEFVSIVGPSGCGKSTLLSIINGLMKPDEGTMQFSNQDIGNRKMRIGYMLQHDELFEWRTIWQNVMLGLEISHKKTKENMEKTKERLKIYGLFEFRNAYPSELSGGMRQRAALVRTLALEPDLLLLDEPFSALDYQTRITVCDDICSIIRKSKKTAILVTHDLSEAISTADRILVLSKRPSSVKADIPVTFDNVQISPMERRNRPEFSVYFNRLWKELADYETKN